MKTYGRTTILANYTEKELLEDSKKDDLIALDEKISTILTNAYPIHEQNNRDSLYLKAYYYGDQDIKDKVKLTRTEINNKTVENWAYAIVDFKKTYLLGKPIQYVQLNDSGGKEISELNKFVRYENKKAKDMELYEDVLVCGRGFRYVNKDTTGQEDDAPFEIINCPVENTEVVYSSKLGNEQLLAYIVTPMQTLNTYVSETGKLVTETLDYNTYQVYLRNMVLTYSDQNGTIHRTNDKPIPLLWKEHLIHEYRVNRKRISLIELGKDLFNDINYLESLDKDDMEQFVNAIMVFTNAEIDEDGLNEMKELGAVCISSTEQKRASVELLQGRLNAIETQTYYTRLLTSLFQILGVPMASDQGTVSKSETGKASLVGQGFTSAGIRAEGDETMFGQCDFNSLKVILSICRGTANSGITTLKASDIDSKFQRDMSDNLLIKTQGLMNLYACDIPREFANSIVNLFGDSNAVTKMQEELFGKQQSQQVQKTNNFGGNTTNDNDIADEQSNKVTKTLEKNNQGQ